MNADIINGLFEAIGGALVLNHCRVLYRDKAVAGVSLVSVAVFDAWGIWNLYYYPSLGQWASFTGGVVIVIANAIWLGMMLHYTGRLYRPRYALRLWRRAPGLSLIAALRYPTGDRSDPIEDADAEIMEMRG